MAAPPSSERLRYYVADTEVGRVMFLNLRADLIAPLFVGESGLEADW